MILDVSKVVEVLYLTVVSALVLHGVNTLAHQRRVTEVQAFLMTWWVLFVVVSVGLMLSGVDFVVTSVK